jgi:biuret amidohydrolase
MSWVPRSLDDLCDPRRTALVVYDMQMGICSQVADSEVIVARCITAVAAARAAGMRVAFTRHLSAPKAWMGVTQLRTGMAWQHTDDPDAVKPWFLRDTPGSAIVSALQPSADDLVVEKLAMSAFEGTPLAFALRDCGITGVALCGIALEIGIAPTVRHAPDLGFIPIVLTDACGHGDAEAAERALATMRFVGEALLTDVADFAGALVGHQ